MLNERPQILVGRGNDAHIGLDRRPASDCCVFALLEHPQQPRLRVHRHVADLVQKQRPAFGLLETPGGTVLRAGKRALLVAEQLGLDQIARNGGHVDGDKWPGLAFAELMQSVGNELLSGAGFAKYQHCQVGLHHPRQNAVDVLHSGGAADQRHFLRRLFLALKRILRLWLRQRPPGDPHQFGQIKGLGKIIIGALF